MATDFDKTTMVNNFDNNTDYCYDYEDKVFMEEKEAKNARWKEMSIGGTFGLLLAGGGLYASGVLDNDSTDALIAGAKAADEANVDVQEYSNTTNDPVLLDDDGNPIPVPEAPINDLASQVSASASTPDSTPDDIGVYHEVIRRTSQSVSLHQPNVQQVERSHTHHTHHVERQATAHTDHTAAQVTGYEGIHSVEVMQCDDNMSFSQAFATARAEMGPGAAFCWRGGVYGTYYREEWHSMTHQQRVDFTHNSVNEAADMFNNAHHDMVYNTHSTHDVNETLNISNPSSKDNQHPTYDNNTEHIEGDSNDVEIIEPNGTDNSDYYPQVVELDGHQFDLLDNDVESISVSGNGNDEDILEMISAHLNDDTQEILPDDTMTETYDYGTPDLIETTDDTSDFMDDVDDLGIL